MWTLRAALKLIRAIQPQVRRTGFHLALAGGVLNRGRSLHDLDLIAVPDDQADQFEVDLITVFKGVGFIKKSKKVYRLVSVYKFFKEKKRIDVVIHRRNNA